MIQSKIRYLKQAALYFFSDIIVVLSGKKHKSNLILKELSNRHIGHRCFIIGNGPSLRKEDLEKLSGEITFASNRIFNIFKDTDWRPTYYAIFDEGVAKEKTVIDGANSIPCEMKFFRQEGYYAYRKIKGPCCYLHSWHSRKYLCQPQFSENLKDGIYTIATVTYALIQIAVYMGIREIYLLGVDNKYGKTLRKDGSIHINKEVKSYFGNQGQTETNSIGATWEMDIAYAYAKKFSEEQGIKIYNATRGGYLEIFERKNLDSVLEQK